jgi:hypothetical protein
MCGNMQKKYKHQVPKQLKVKTRRINITCRAFKSSFLRNELEIQKLPMLAANLVLNYLNQNKQ